MEDMDFVAVRTCQSHEEATIIQNALQQEGIPCTLDNDHQGGLTGVLAIRILVPSDKKEAADQFLTEHHSDQIDQPCMASMAAVSSVTAEAMSLPSSHNRGA